jgi:hypothetical protein
MEDMSKLRQAIYQLNKKRWALLQDIMKPGKLLTASFYERFTKCGSPSCKCASGELHGPFPWIYQNRKGEKLISTSCVAEKVEDAGIFSENYKKFKESRAQIKAIDEEIQSLIKQIETLNEVDAKEFTKKEGEKRGRKQKKSEKSVEEEEN